MTRWSIGLAVLAMISLHGCGLWPGEERKIARRLDDLAEAASVTATENPIIQMANAAKVAAYFTEDAKIDWGDNSQPLVGRDAVTALAAQASMAVQDLRVRVVDAEIAVNGSDTASVHLTLVVSGRPRSRPNGWASSGSADQGVAGSGLDARELFVILKKIDGDWLIASVETLKTLERPQ